MNQRAPEWLDEVEIVLASGFNFHPQSDVDIINSLNNSNISSKIIQCAVRILKTAKRSFRISHVPCQLQKDGYNGGVFAIAFARALAFKINPSEIRFGKATHMREHLLLCFKEKNLKLFPTSVFRSNTSGRLPLPIQITVYYINYCSICTVTHVDDSTRSQKGACVYLWAKYVDCSYLMDKWIESIESILERRSEPFHHNVDVKCNN